MPRPDSDKSPASCLKLVNLPPGTVVHNIETSGREGRPACPLGGHQRPAYCPGRKVRDLRMPSGEMRMISVECKATVGQVGNIEHENISLGKAGRTRWPG